MSKKDEMTDSMSQWVRGTEQKFRSCEEYTSLIDLQMRMDPLKNHRSGCTVMMDSVWQKVQIEPETKTTEKGLKRFSKMRG